MKIKVNKILTSSLALLTRRSTARSFRGAQTGARLDALRRTAGTQRGVRRTALAVASAGQDQPVGGLLYGDRENARQIHVVDWHV